MQWIYYALEIYYDMETVILFFYSNQSLPIVIMMTEWKARQNDEKEKKTFRHFIFTFELLAD